MARQQPDDEMSLSYYGWRVVAAASLGVMVSFGSLLVFTFGIFLKPLAGEFGWSREEISRAFGIAAMTIAVSSPLLGRALDRLPTRSIVLPCFAVFGLAILALSQMTGQLWQFYLIFFVIGVTGNATTQMGYSGAVSSWFDRHRGLALAVVLGGVGVGSIVHPILAQWCIDHYGWRSAYLLLGGLVLGLGMPLTALWVRRRGDDVQSVRSEKGSGAGEALRVREFWILAAVLFLSSLAANGALTHLAAHLSDRGMAATQAALVTGVLGVANLCGRLLTGWMLDRLPGPRLSCFLLVAMAAGMLTLSSFSTGTSTAVALGAAVLIGVGLGGEADITPYLLSRYFGLRAFSTLYGVTWTVYAMAGALGPMIFGRVFDASHSYSTVLTAGAGVTLAAGLIMLAMRPAANFAAGLRSGSVSAGS
jgi:predicted MFS family arabinose efflux permease